MNTLMQSGLRSDKETVISINDDYNYNNCDMKERESGWLKKHGGKIVNVVLITLVLLLIFVPDAKSWMMRQLLWTGLFNVQVEKEVSAPDKNISELGLT